MSCCQSSRRDVGSVWCVARFIAIVNNAFGDETGKKIMPWLQMSRFLSSSGFDQSWHWLCTVNWLLAHTGKTQLHLASHSRCMIYNENLFFTFPILNVVGHAVILQLLTTCITKHIVPEYGSRETSDLIKWKCYAMCATSSSYCRSRCISFSSSVLLFSTLVVFGIRVIIDIKDTKIPMFTKNYEMSLNKLFFVKCIIISSAIFTISSLTVSHPTCLWWLLQVSGMFIMVTCHFIVIRLVQWHQTWNNNNKTMPYYTDMVCRRQISPPKFLLSLATKQLDKNCIS